ncbi:hypothetical protein MMJ53_01585 [Enterococcus cecorum]|uniref:hypothetical protein n=2 Tax=Enterococcus cecorum TaxID=44008 RepID=UPI001FAC840E|nr:hypothetical protein [Enterococcus cecorum]MCJ0556895.1 hypothetical protein [Enterococcus cecorum]MCJ0561488.1 hypothetical protein [Enterococcus cecorum]
MSMSESLFEMVYSDLTEEEKELKKIEMREAKQLKECIMKRLMNKFNNKKVADLFYYNVVAIGTQKGARHDYLEALKVLTVEEIDEIEKRVTGFFM